MSRKKLAVGVIGLGHWGPNVVRNLANHPRVRLVSVCDISKSKFHQVRDLVQKECQFTTKSSHLINNPDIDAIVIITPASTHYNLIRESLIAKKHVLGEKPIALDVKESETLCKLAEQSKLKLMTGFTFLFNNAIRKLKELVDSERLGRLYYLTTSRTHMGLIRQDVNVVWDLAPHDISIMNYLIGTSPEKVSAVGAAPVSQDRSDFAFINLSYPSGIVGQIHVSWINSNKERVVRVIGSKARAEFDDLNNLEPVRIFEKGIGNIDHVEPDYGEFQFLLRDGDIISPKVEMIEPLKQMIDNFVNVVLDDAENISDGRFALKVTKVVAAIQRSIISGGAPQEVR